MNAHPLTRYRSQNGLSRRELAALLGVSEAMVGHIESGIRRLNASRAVQAERAHGIPRAITRPDLFAA